MSDRQTLSELQRRFVQRNFPGGEGLSSDIIRIHDAAHEYANIAPTEYGEAQQTFVDMAGTRELARRTGARGFANSMPFTGDDQGISTQRFMDDSFMNRQVEWMRENVNDFASAYNKGNELSFDELNSPRRTYFPSITKEEVDELQRRGREFYGKLAEDWATNKDRLDVPSGWRGNANAGDSDTPFARMPFNNGTVDSELPVNRAAWSIHRGGDVLGVAGGYGRPGVLPHGSMMQFVQPPVHPGVDESIYRKLAHEAARRELQGLRGQLGTARGPANAELKAGEVAVKYGLPDTEATRVGTMYGENISYPEYYEAAEKKQIDDLLSRRTFENYVDKTLPAWANEVKPGQMESALRMPRTPESSALAATAREIDRVRNAARTATRVTADVAGAVPWMDPDFRNALERDDIGKAAGIVARDYAIGAASAPVVGAAAGVAQRVAPGLASRALPVAAGLGAASRVLNPIAALTLLGGDTSRPGGRDRAREAAEMRVVEDQRRRAEEARARGPRWRIGPFAVPELGISESGGLFLGGGSAQRVNRPPARGQSRPASRQSSPQPGWLGFPQQILRQLTGR